MISCNPKFLSCPQPPPSVLRPESSSQAPNGKGQVVLCGSSSFHSVQLLFVAVLPSDPWRRWSTGPQQCSLAGTVDFLSSHYWGPPTSCFRSQKMISGWLLLSPPLPTPTTISQIEALYGHHHPFGWSAFKDDQNPAPFHVIFMQPTGNLYVCILRPYFQLY